MLDNVPVRRLEHAGLTIEGYSRAAVQSCWRVAELKIGFDLGIQPWDFMGTPTWVVSHTHLDHIAALAVYVARRRMMKMDPPQIYLPADAVDSCRALLRVFSRLDRGRLPCELIGLQPGDEVELNRELVFRAVPTRHTIPSLGYIVYQRRQKLKPEFQDRTGDQLRDLRLAGEQITHEIRVPLVGYTGDTAPAGLDDNPDMYAAKVLISEMTFVAPGHRKEKIHKHGHMHLDDWVARSDQFANELVIAAHFSTRYNNRQVRRWVEKRLPEMLGGRLHLWL